MIANDTNSGNSIDFVEDAACGLINDINAVNTMDCADIIVLDDTADGLIVIATNAGNLTNCA